MGMPCFKLYWVECYLGLLLFGLLLKGFAWFKCLFGADCGP